MNDPQNPRKKLGLKKAITGTPARPALDRRKRSGGRARQMAQIERAREADPRNRRAPPVTNPQASEPLATEPLAAESRAPASRASTPHPSAPHKLAPAPRTPTSRPRAIAPAEIFPVFTPCPQGLEEALVAEMQTLGFEDAQSARAGCSFHADWTGIQRANLYSRLATRVLVQVAQGPALCEDDIFDLAYNTEWERWFGAEQTLRVDTSAIRSPMQSLQFCNLRAKDGICDRLRDREGARPDIDTVRPDARVHLFLTEDSATLYLDTSGESLFKRGWRLDKGTAPIRENLAAGLLALSNWDPSQALLDPFCGSGTILIEAAWIALGIPPGIWRPFSFERLRHHDTRHWQDLKDDAQSHIALELENPLVGCDIDPAAIEAATRNTERAGLTPDAIYFDVGDARSVPPPAHTGWLVTNPPYGERLSADEMGLWREWSQNLKRNFSDWKVNIISSDLNLPGLLRLKPQRRYPLFNGDLDCRLFSFEMVKAGYRD